MVGVRIQLVELCGARCGDKGDISDISLFADDEAAYQAIKSAVTAAVVKAHFGRLVTGAVERYEAPNVLALKFVMHEALGGGGPRSLRSDNLGKTHAASLLRLWIEVPDEVAASARRRIRAPLDRAIEDASSLPLAGPGRQRPQPLDDDWQGS